MPQKTNLNVNPYYDDFDKDDNFYKVLFKPGYPVQARELTGLQSILQNQIESFGSHVFKEGSMVIPGGVTCDNQFTTIKVNRDHLGIDVSVYLDAIVGANNGKGSEVISETTDIRARIKGYLLPPEEGVEDITLFVKYAEGGSEDETVEFQDGEVLVLQDNVTYGNTSIVSGDTIFTLTSVDAVNTGYAVGVAQGVYFIRGTFVDVSDSLIVLDPYNNEPSYRVGFDIIEEIVNSDQEPELNDNAKGFTNYAAPGADRLRIRLNLAKKLLTDTEDTSFVELVRVDEGEIKKLQNRSQYSEIKKYFAKRTFEESGNYAVDNFVVDVVDLLNDETGNGGLFTEEEVTDEGNVPEEKNMGIRVSAGTAYVKGFDVDHVGSTIIDVPKPRDTKPLTTASIPFAVGSLIRVNNVYGTPYINIGTPASGGATNTNIINLYNKRRDNTGNAGTRNAGNGDLVGKARVYWFGVTDAKYKDAGTSFDLYLYDLQTFTNLTLGNTYNTTDVPDSSRVRGLSSGATGYIESRSTNTYTLSQTSGTFIRGEQVVINEDSNTTSAIQTVEAFDTTDIKMVWQDCSSLNTALVTDFVADTVLYEQELPDFGVKDLLEVDNGNEGRVAGRLFDTTTGIKPGSIIKYQVTGQTDATYNEVTKLRRDGSTISLIAAPAAIPGVCQNTVTDGQRTFSLMVPRVLGYGNNGMYSTLPVENIASVDLANSNLTITKQITGKTAASGSITFTVADAIDISSGITSVFFEPFDAEKYTLTDTSTGTPIALDSGMVNINAGGNSVTFTNVPNQVLTASVTLKKMGVTNKTKDFTKSASVDITRTSGTTTANGLTASKFYGTRVEDEEISLNVPDAVNVRAIYESTTDSAPVLDKLTFATGLALDQSVIVGEKIVGQENRAVAQVVAASSNTIDYVPLNNDDFTVGETVRFSDSALDLTIQEVTPGSFLDLTPNYRLDKGQRHQYCDYSRIIRRPGSPTPSRRLKVIFDHYTVASNNTGDIFTVNSYGADRFKNDIPTLPDGLRVSDLIDFRPRVEAFDPSATAASPFAFTSREYDYNYKYVVTPDESSFIGFTYYLPRIDLVSINRLGEIEVTQGVSADDPKAPVLTDDSMELAQVLLPPYLYNTVSDPRVELRDNRRFTMRDIGKLEDRIENLEEMTSLTMLELNAKTLEVTDANGLNRFKSGFIVSDFRDKSLMDPRLSTVDISKGSATCIAPVDFWSIDAELKFDPSVDVETADLSDNLPLAPNSGCQKTGDMITLEYEQKRWINQPHATNVENVNPFNVIVFVGGIVMDPASDNWVRTIYLNDHRTESTGAKWKQEAKTTRDVDKKVEYRTYKKGGGRGEKRRRKFVTTTITTTTKYTPKLRGPSREFDYVEDVKVSGEADPWMRSRNVGFYANGLRPYQRHYFYLDSQPVDYLPKLCEIEMKSGTFKVNEEVEIFNRKGKKIGFLPIVRPNHKIGNTLIQNDNQTRRRATPDNAERGFNLGNPTVLRENYQVDPYDKNRPAPGNGYSPTSRLINFALKRLARRQKYYGFVKKGFTIVGKTSGACATVTDKRLIADNWGDVLGSFFIRNANAKPRPRIRIKSGTKTVKITANPPNKVVLPGSTLFASEAIGQYSGSGTILTQETSRVSVRNPPRPKRKKTEVEVKVKAPHRDPLAQSFTVDGTGAFLTSFDLFFANKDPKAKVFVELRTMELGTPTSFLVQDYTQIALNPDDIFINEENPFDPIPTNIAFESPVYLEPEVEYAIVVLSPGSDLYEMWTATMGKKTVNTSQLPNVRNVVVTKQYIGGSLFKSQNGTIWTPSQYQDLMFTLYKAKFTKKAGTVNFFNTDITPKGDNAQDLNDNPIEALPRKLKLPITGTLAGAVVKGTRVTQGQTFDSINGYVENLGAPITTGAASVSIASSGTDYKVSTTSTGVDLISLTGKGSGAQATIVTDATGFINSVNITNAGSGYVNGETLGITTADMGGTGGAAGSGARLTVNNLGSTDTLYLTNVQGENFTNTEDIYYFSSPSVLTDANVNVNGTSSIIDDKFSGNVFRIKQQNHAHHGGNNKIEIVDIEPDTSKTTITETLGVTGTQVSVANTTVFATSEGISTSRGYALLNSEVVEYTAVSAGANNTGSLTISSRGQNGTAVSDHAQGSAIQPYEVNGVSLMRINRTHNIPSTYYRDSNSNLDFYHLEFDRTLAVPQGRGSGNGMLNFAAQKGFGGNSVGISQNYQFSSIEPVFNIITPGKGTKATSAIRTISGTSAGGTEVSFLDQGYEDVLLNKVNQFRTPRMVASRVNELAYLTGQQIQRNKSLNLRVAFSTEDENLSPIIDLQNATFVLGRNKTNKPVNDYIEDGSANLIDGDPHGAVFVTKTISLAKPASSLKIIIAANREEGADFRVLYQLFRADSSNIDQKFTPFPGYDNLIDTDGDGFGDRVKDPNKNSGRADAFVPANDAGQFSEYQFSANNLEQFTAFAIKVVMSSTNESTPVQLKDFRAIALA